MKEFISWGVMGDWKTPYKTMDSTFVKNQIELFQWLLSQGYIYQRYMPVYWSPSSKTALAESELEYNVKHQSTAIYTRFKITKNEHLADELFKTANIWLLVWTTTPWSLVANRAVCFNPKLEYCFVKHPLSEDFYIVAVESLQNKELKEIFGDTIIPQQSDKIDLKELISECVLLIGGVLIPGAEAPKLITKDMLKVMKRGSVIVDVAIDQGGCVETSKPTTHANPTYIVDNVVHYCVANMPGGVPRTSTLALNKATLPFLTKLAKDGYKKSLNDDENFLAGLNVCQGNVTYKAVADIFGHEYISAKEAIN